MWHINNFSVSWFGAKCSLNSRCIQLPHFLNAEGVGRNAGMEHTSVFAFNAGSEGGNKSVC